jgi:putative restriction endonuclease
LDAPYEGALRAAALAWLDARAAADGGFHLFPSQELREGFSFDGGRIPLVGPQQGIWKPARLGAALSIRTTFTPPGGTPPYDDALEPDGCLRYKYRGQDPAHPDNRALRAAMEWRLPLVWFWGVAPALYEAVRPVWLIGEEPAARQFAVAVDEAQRSVALGEGAGEAERRYALRLTKQRVHQPLFRAQVVAAYGQCCAICRLRYPSLLDAAHIVRDGQPRGDPVVENGLSLCKIHHAAFDQNLLGVDPDHLAVEVRADVRDQTDGPMLRHGLQEMQGVRLVLPASRRAHPDRSRLAERWREFRSAG